jgi:hypothetical protein
MISLLIPVSTAAFAFATVFLAALVIVALKVFGWKEITTIELHDAKSRIRQMTKA